MTVQISELRQRLKTYLDMVRAGEELVVTDRGVPVARLIGADAAPLVERLVRDGTISAPNVGARPHLTRYDRVHATGSVSDLGEQRR